MNEVPHVYACITAVSAEIAKEGIAKTRNNQQQGYKFRGIDDVYNALAPLISKHGLVIVPRILSRELVERQTKTGNTLFNVTVEAEFDFVSAKDGSKVTARSFGEAMDSADKATNKAMSAAYKYTAFQTFCIPTEGDNDADAHTPEPTSEVHGEPEHVTQLRESLKKQPGRQQVPPDSEPESDGIGPRVKYTKVAKEGTNDKGPWTLYAVGLTDGREGTTFSKSIYAAAKDLMEHGRVVTAKFQGKNLLAIAPQEIPDSRDEAPF